jgi:hypothetical protein
MQTTNETTLRLLSVTFQTTIEPWELSQFRGAMAHKVGLENEWFHNHNNEDPEQPKLHYRYPLIQYKLHQKHPMLLCLDKGVEEAHHFFAQPDWSLRIGKEAHDMRIQKLQLDEFNIRLLNRPQRYRLHNWLALNSENHKAYHDTLSIATQMQLLERVLTSHLLRFAEGIDWRVPDQIEIAVTALHKVNRVSFKEFKKEAFNIDFVSNLFIPDFVGLGQGSSLGFGVVKRYK